MRLLIKLLRRAELVLQLELSDPIIGTTILDAVKMFMDDNLTDCIIGEIGGVRLKLLNGLKTMET